MSKKQSSRRKGPQQLFYTEAFKQKIINEVLSGKLSKRQASLIYSIKGNATRYFVQPLSEDELSTTSEKQLLTPNFGNALAVSRIFIK